MNAKKMIIGFLTVFAISLLISMGVSFLWSLFFHEVAKIDWESSFRFAIILGIILPILDSRKK
jgi:ABC-type phosphate transport system permease subunit